MKEPATSWVNIYWFARICLQSSVRFCMRVLMLYVNLTHNALLLFSSLSDLLVHIFYIYKQARQIRRWSRARHIHTLYMKKVDASFIFPFFLLSCFITVTKVPVRIGYKLAVSAIAGTVNQQNGPKLHTCDCEWSISTSFRFYSNLSLLPLSTHLLITRAPSSALNQHSKQWLQLCTRTISHNSEVRAPSFSS